MEKILKHLGVNSVLILCVIIEVAFVAYFVLAIHTIAKQNAASITIGRETAETLAKHNEQLILDFMSRTVDRWDKLQRDNPELKVPFVVEPLTGPHLQEEEMKRP